MSTNKHATIRYQALDRCFSNFGRRFYIDDLVEACNRAIHEFTGNDDGVKVRQVYDDIRFMESETGFCIELDKRKDGKKTYYRYIDKNFSINRQPLSHTEAEQLKNTIAILNRFKGLPQFDWMKEVLTRFEDTFKLKANVDSVVSFEQNPYLKGLEYFTDLFNAIINQQVLTIEYCPAFKEKKTIVLHPYHLKQYNNRWFLFGHNSDFKEISPIMNLAIDRIESVNQDNKKYTPNTFVDFDDYFDDVVGVTVLINKPIEIVRLKVDNQRYNYIKSKPIHHSQKVIERGNDYTIIELRLIPNYELETLILGFIDSIEILSPQTLIDSLKARVDKIVNKRSKIVEL